MKKPQVIPYTLLYRHRGRNAPCQLKGREVLENMYTCWRCKGETPNRRLEYLSEKYPEKYPEKYISTCDKCRKELDDEYEFENEQCDSDIICPACLKSFQPDDGYGYDADGDEVQCDYCGEWYSLTAEHSITFTTKRILKPSERK